MLSSRPIPVKSSWYPVGSFDPFLKPDSPLKMLKRATNLCSQESHLKIPDRFWKVEYNIDHYPGSPETDGLKGGANCQQFAYEILRHFGRYVSDLRSSDLWEDSVDPYHVTALKPLDLLLFHSRENPWALTSQFISAWERPYTCRVNLECQRSGRCSNF